LRNAVLGQFLERVYEFIGYDVNVQYYLDDLGTQVSTSLLGIERLAGEIKAADYKKFDHYAWDIYSRISKMIEEDQALKKELDELMQKLDLRDPMIAKKQMELSKKILHDNLVTFSHLDIDYDLIVDESSIKDFKMWDKTFDLLKRNEFFYYAESGPSKGCWLVRMGANKFDSSDDNTSPEGIEEDKIIVRSNGVPTYTGKTSPIICGNMGYLIKTLGT